MKYSKENTESIKRVFETVSEKYVDDFKLIFENANFLFTFRDKPIYDDEGMEIAAFAKCLNNRERDLYGYDFEICVYEELWNELTEKGKQRLMYHELLHCKVSESEDDDDTPGYDKEGRLAIYCEPHDIYIKTFKQEIIRFGLSNRDLDASKFLHGQFEKFKEKAKLKKENK